MTDFLQELRNPSAKWRAKPFWAWNGKLDKDELLRQVKVIQEMGNGGFFMHSRVGLQTQYLGEEWFECINACADEAEKLGLEAWLYDEDRWPSGIAGGMVTKNPEYSMQALKMEICSGADFLWDETILRAFSCRLQGVNCYDCKRISRVGDADLSAMTVLVFRVVRQSPHSFYNGFTYVDTLNKDATQRFLVLTHEKYKAQCGDRLGRSIKGIFTDEPFRGILLNDIVAGNDGDSLRVPWTGKLPEAFINRYGYDLLDQLPGLFLLKNGEAVSQVKWHYVDLVLEMFLNNFLAPVHQWCRANNILLTGHIFHEDTLAIQTITCGSAMRCYDYMDYPGVDVLGEQNKNFWIVKQLDSAARQTGKRYKLSELNGCTGWQMDFEAYKRIGDWQAFFGINLRCQHLAWYTMEGQAKRDYPASILHQSAWWREACHLEDYFARIGFVMSTGSPCCDLLVLNPVESLWCRVYAGWSRGFFALDRRACELDEIYAAVFRWLVSRGIDFDYGDEGMMAQCGDVCRDEAGYPVVLVGKAEYRTVLVCGMDTIRSSTVGLLARFVAIGGKVIFAGDVPAFQDAAASAAPLELSQLAVRVPMAAEEICRKAMPRDDWIAHVSCSGKAVDDVFCRMRYQGATRIIMLLNLIESPRHGLTVSLRRPVEGAVVYEVGCESGELVQARAETLGDSIQIETGLEGYGEKILLITSDEMQAKPPVASQKLIRSYRLPQICPYELAEPNVCVLDIARYRLWEEPFGEAMEILKLDRHLRRSLGMQYRSGEMLQPWFIREEKHSETVPLELEFSFDISGVPQVLELALEHLEYFMICINGHAVEKRVCGQWIDQCFSRIPIQTDLLQVGRNTVLLRTDFYGQDLEAIYLIGDFGVAIDGSQKRLDRLPLEIKFQDLTQQGLPFYSGGIRYRVNIRQISLSPGERACLEVEKPAAAYVRVVSDQQGARLAAWPPYKLDVTDLVGSTEVVLEAVLTRRNTFGPLHLTHPLQPFYGPDEFMTEGDGFTDQYGLLPSGVLLPPIINIYQDKQE